MKIYQKYIENSSQNLQITVKIIYIKIKYNIFILK